MLAIDVTITLGRIKSERQHKMHDWTVVGRTDENNCAEQDPTPSEFLVAHGTKHSNFEHDWDSDDEEPPSEPAPGINEAFLFHRSINLSVAMAAVLYQHHWESSDDSEPDNGSEELEEIEFC